MSEVFSGSYAEARAAFLKAAGQATRSEAVLHPSGTGPGGEALYLDVAWFGRPDAPRVFMTVSGTHGQEGFAGSAAQIGFLRSDALRDLPGDVALLFIHASNPWGWANFSRTTENNVDLNRNFVDHSVERRAHALYAELDAVLKIRDLTREKLDAIWPRMVELIQRHGAQEAVNAIAAGQYNDPRGTNYGGVAPEWSNSTVRDVVRRYCAGSRKVGFIDWHTGLGDFGESFFMSFDDELSPEYRRAAQWWGEATLQRGKGGPDNGMPWPKYTGLLLQGVQQEIVALGAQFTGVVVEFGTYPLPEMFSSLIVDQWLKYGAPSSPGVAQEWRDWMMERFCPADPEWRRRVVDDSTRTYRQGIAGLAAW